MDRTELLVNNLYEKLIVDTIKEYSDMLGKDPNSFRTEKMKYLSSLFQNTSNDNKEHLLNLVYDISVNTVMSLLGWIDGEYLLKDQNDDEEPKLVLIENDVTTEGYWNDTFIPHDQEQEEAVKQMIRDLIIK